MCKFTRLIFVSVLFIIFSTSCVSDVGTTPALDNLIPTLTDTQALPRLTSSPDTSTPTTIPSSSTATREPAQTLTPVLESEIGVEIFGGPLNDRSFDVLVTSDGGLLIAGMADNNLPSHRITPGRAQLVRTDYEGNILWEKKYGGTVDAIFNSIIQAGEDEYVILGEIAASYLRDESDVYLVKVDGKGNEIWSRTFGGRGMDLGKMVQQTADGGFILVGDQADEYPTENLFKSKIYLIKTDADGNEIWSQTYGEEILYIGWGVVQTPDGDYILTGWEAKTLDDRDVILIKTDSEGNEIWSRTWDPGERDGGFDLILSSDGHIIVACIQSMGSGTPSARLIKIDLNGNEIWNKRIGEEGIGNTFWHILEDWDGGYLMVGDTHLEITPVVHGALVVKTDSDGEIVWQRVFGEGEYEQAHFNSAALLPGGGYIFVGDITGYGESFSDIWWVKTDNEGNPIDPAIGQQPPLVSTKRIAFASERDGILDIYVMDFKSGEMTRLTVTKDHDSGPTWSPDGMRIAFMSEKGGNHDIYVMNADGSEVSRLTNDPADDFGAAWSPDGEWISFTSNRDGNLDIYLMEPDGSNLIRLTDAPGTDANPAWSPDGTKIAFSSDRDGDLDIYVMDINGSNLVRLTDNLAQDVDPSWSPDGKRIIFSSNRDYPDPEDYTSLDNNWEIYVMAADGSDATRLTDHPAYDIAGRWSPDGDRILFVSTRDGEFRIYMMNTDGSNLARLTGDSALEESPAWSPIMGTPPTTPAVADPSPTSPPP